MVMLLHKNTQHAMGVPDPRSVSPAPHAQSPFHVIQVKNRKLGQCVVHHFSWPSHTKSLKHYFKTHKCHVV